MNATLTPDAPSWEREFDADDHENFEVVDGVRVEVPPMSVDSQVLATRLSHRLNLFGMERGLGEAYVETLFRLPLDEDRNRKPDVAFVPYSRWAKDRVPPSTNEWDVLPDLCVEVVSPSDRADYILDKIEEYFRAGVRLVWAFYPRHRVVHVYDSFTSIRVLAHVDTIDGGVVLPGFRLGLEALFPSSV